jgi:hypothetical protein
MIEIVLFFLYTATNIGMFGYVFIQGACAAFGGPDYHKRNERLVVWHNLLT